MYQGTTPARAEVKSVADVGKAIRALSAIEALRERKSLTPGILARNRSMFSCESVTENIFAVNGGFWTTSGGTTCGIWG